MSDESGDFRGLILCRRFIRQDSKLLHADGVGEQVLYYGIEFGECEVVGHLRQYLKKEITIFAVADGS